MILLLFERVFMLKKVTREDAEQVKKADLASWVFSFAIPRQLQLQGWGPPASFGGEAHISTFIWLTDKDT